MKRLNYILSFLLLFFVGASVSAQTLKLGEQLKEIPTDGTTQVFLQTATTTAYWDGDIASPKDDVTDDCAAILEPTGESVDGYPTYYIKQVSTGKYLKNHVLHDGWDSSDLGVTIGTTENKSEAFKATILNYDENGGFRTNASSGNGYQTPSEELFVICSDYTYEYEGQTYPTYLGWYGGTTFMSPYVDTNGWYIYTVDKASGAEQLEKVINTYFPTGVTEANFPAGNQPGYYDQAAFDAAKAVYDEAQALLASGEELSDEQVEEISARLQAASEQLANGIVPITTGYYFLLGAGRGETPGVYALYDNGTGLKWNTTAYEIPTTLTQDDTKYIFHITVNDDNTIYIKNLETGRYPQTIAMSTDVKTATDSIPYAYAATTTGMTASFIFWATSGTGNYQKLHEAAGGSVVGWSDTSASTFQVVPVTATDQIAELLKAIEQKNLNTSLSTLWGTAGEALHAATAYKADADNLTAEGYVLFDDLGLVNDGAQLECNYPDPDEGQDIGALVDTDKSTYFHTSWHSTGSHTDYHYIQADLGQAVQTIVFQFLKRQGAANDHLKTFRLLATNDTTGTWSDQGIYTVSYEKNAIVAGDTLNNQAAITGANMNNAYRFVRIVGLTTSTTRDITYPYWHAAELRFYNGAEDPDNSTLGQVDAAVVSALEAQLAAAQATIEAGNATQADIDALQAAYDAFDAQMPHPEKITAAITTLSNAIAGYYFSDQGEVGSFPAEQKESAQAVITEAQAEVNGKTNSQWTVADVNAAIAKIEAAKAALDGAMILPTEGKTYTIRTATTSTSYGRAANAPIYAKNSSLSTGLAYMVPAQTGEDSVTVADHYNYVWLAESVDAEKGTVLFRNLYTGRYIGQQASVSTAVTQSAEAVALPIVSARVASAPAVGIKVNNAEGNVQYLNTGSNGSIVAWSEGEVGADNSAYTIEEIDLTDGAGLTYVPVTAGTKQIITLPFAAGTFVGEGTACTSTGVDATSDDIITLEALDMDAVEAVAAGEPFVYEAAAGETELPIYISLDDNGLPKWGFEGKFVNGLVGSVDGTTIPGNALTNGAWIYSSGNLVNVPESAADYMKAVSANGGYITVSDPTGIQAADATINTNAGNGKVYDLQGRRVAKATKGLYIINGKKVLVK